ncbi:MULTISPECIES: ferritin-like domain-containing protein [Pseudomonas]|jgi:ferritin-like metal-binding protein YciE|uniref:Ferritin-like domain-containing protein n=1 Tax=Pseudomonas tritici TaxID=2745518 RepID=A0A8H9YT96_9PSED
MQITTLEDLFSHDLSDVYSAEKQILRALPKMSRAASDPQLISAFEQHLEETRVQIERLDRLVETTDFISINGITCQVLEGLAEEAQEIMDSIDAGPVRDAGLIGAAQKVEHYEIAAYGTLHALALKLGLNEAAELLAETLQEEKETDKKLTAIAGLHN